MDSILLFALLFVSLLPIASTSRQGLKEPGGNSARVLPELHYRNNLELEESLKLLTKKCSNIMRLYSIGRSHIGFPLWVIEISDKPGESEEEPAFKYVGNLHGDEPVGRELLLLLADWLCTNYMKDPLATDIVTGLHLHLLPSMNPDGFQLRSRFNAKNIDLNRDFPDQFFSMNNDESLRQPETVAVMNWTRNNRFVASASLHGGAVVANYPWDGTSDHKTKYSMCDDDKTFQYLAKRYSTFHAIMSNSSEFPEGITNGAAWYPLYGGMQDWNYIHGKCMDLTLEITENKWPLASELEDVWKENRLSMLMLVASVLKCGVHGRVISSFDGRPLAARISVKGINFTVFASKEYGDYYRLLNPGSGYQLTASMPGYVSHTVKVTTQEGKATRLDFKLELQIREPKQRSSGEHVGLEVGNIDNDTDDEDSVFSLEKLLNNISFGKRRMSASYDRDTVAELLTGHLEVTSITLMICVLLLFTVFILRYRKIHKMQKNSRHLRS